MKFLDGVGYFKDGLPKVENLYRLLRRRLLEKVVHKIHFSRFKYDVICGLALVKIEMLVASQDLHHPRLSKEGIESPYLVAVQFIISPAFMKTLDRQFVALHFVTKLSKY